MQAGGEMGNDQEEEFVWEVGKKAFACAASGQQETELLVHRVAFRRMSPHMLIQ